MHIQASWCSVALLSLALGGCVRAMPAAQGTPRVQPPREDLSTRERVARGEALVAGLNGGRPQPVLEAMRRDFPFLAEATAGYALNDVWGRKELDVRTRQLAALAAFASLGQLAQFKVHAGYALEAGVKPEELKEIVYLITVPAGFPRAIDASQALKEVFDARGLR
ncbi:carboxymuconolactone decarboxylase family protein [Pyxidicoccus fallax]|uniref:Carboxymuconolactone decarboxylase family protein n=1 Tax=Pyxidicoccus fallax TaxID=394095 RepID=A0A848LXD5_9BACT|nr:carboxymuconolactone decarboxylase family protein [Pyxidicoccus fallax]NMO22289.1 carboxymuconolactone decarboxylase family protein [Pyxidicoccus fallax]NPC83907.1 carboxymuconolactone decarboxylase family protein [Pyxidicoccus fallax]